MRETASGLVMVQCTSDFATDKLLLDSSDHSEIFFTFAPLFLKVILKWHLTYEIRSSPQHCCGFLLVVSYYHTVQYI